jgi:hypothetical protein
MSEKDDDLSNLTAKERFEKNKNKIANSQTQTVYTKNPHFKPVLNQIQKSSTDPKLSKSIELIKPAPPPKPRPSQISIIPINGNSTNQPESLPSKINSNKTGEMSNDIDRSSSFNKNKKYFDWTEVIPKNSVFNSLPTSFEKEQSEFKKIDIKNLSRDPSKPPESVKLNPSDIEKLSKYQKSFS